MGESAIKWGMPDETSYALDAWQLCKNEVLRSGESYAIKAYRNADIRNSKYDNRIT